MSYNHLELPDISANLDRKRDVYGDDCSVRQSDHAI